MTRAQRRYRLLALGLTTIAAACSSPAPVLYTIAPAEGIAHTGGPRVILLQQVGIERYLDRSQIVHSSENYRLDVMANDWWGEPLAAMLDRTLATELAQRFPQSTVLRETGVVTSAPDATVELNVQRLDEDAAGSVVLRARSRRAVQRRKGVGRADLPLCRGAAGARRPRAGCRDEHGAWSACRWDRCDAARTTGPAMMWTSPRRPAIESSLHECSSCGLLQTIPALMPGMTARCARCPATLRHTSTHTLEHSIALTTAALVLLIIMCMTPLMGVEKAAISRSANLFSGPAELVRHGMSPLAAVVVFVTVVAPFGKLLGTLYVLIRLREARPPRHLRRVFFVAEKLRPWSMIEVFVFGVFVAYVKLSDLVHLQLDPGVFALLALTVVLIWSDTALDREAIWDRLAPRKRTPAKSRVALFRTALQIRSGARLAGWSVFSATTTRIVRAVALPCMFDGPIA